MPEKLDFITPTVLKVLYLFHEDSMQTLHEREVMRRARISKGSANSILRKLAEADILERRETGRMVFYRFNNRNAVARQLKVLFNVYSLQRLVVRLAPHSKRVILFGSCAEGMDTRGSDVDLFILTQEREEVIGEINACQKNLERRLSPLVVNANEFANLRRADRPLYERVLKGIVLWESE
jgi:predicted nucleotidyltransferase